jgi:DNA-binding NtrC family response regulator
MKRPPRPQDPHPEEPSPRDTHVPRPPDVLRNMEELEAMEADLPGTAPRASRDLRARVDDWTAEQGLLAVRHLTAALSGQLDVHRVARTVLEHAIRAMGAERGLLFLGRPEAGLVPVLGMNIEARVLAAVEKVSRTVLATADLGELVVASDALTDPRFAGVESVQLNEMHSVLCVPLATPGGQLGALYLDARHPHAFPARMTSLLETIATVAAVALETARAYGELQTDFERVRSVDRGIGPLDRLAGPSAKMTQLRHQAEVASRLEQPVLIVGEQGSGRRFLARVIHDAGRRGHEPFVSIDCGVIPAASLRGIVLGRSGAGVRDGQTPEPGLVPQADHGTLYLAESQQVDEELAGDLARLLGRRSYQAVGSKQVDRADVRLILSIPPERGEDGSSPRLARALASGVRDLCLSIPPLRERPEDIPALVAGFLQDQAGTTRGGSRVTFTADAIRLLQSRLWVGNVRELRDVVQRIVFYRPGPTVDAMIAREILAEYDETDSATGPWSGRILPMREWEDEAIRRALLYTRGNRMEAAQLLGLHRNTILKRLQEMEQSNTTRADGVSVAPARRGRPRRLRTGAAGEAPVTGA